MIRENLVFQAKALIGKYSIRVLTRGALVMLAACSSEESPTVNSALREAGSVASIDAVATFGYANDVVDPSSTKVTLSGEYANFSKKCSPQASMIGAIHYPRKLEKFTSGAGTIPMRLENADDRSCPLHLVSIQAEVVDGAGVKVASAATTYDLSKAGEEAFSCYYAVGGPGYCLVNSPLSARAREAGRKRLVGTINILWRY